MGPVSHPKLYVPRVASLYMKVFSEIEAIRPHLVFISRSSEREYGRLYGTAFSSSCVIYPGMRTEIKPGTSAAVKAIRKPFLLTVGTIGVRKNQKRSVQAFRRSGLKDLDYQYVLTGPPAYGYQDVCDEIGLDDSVNITGYVSDDQLRWLYSNASGFVLPSLLEGFGIPAVEAVLNNLVPLVSKDSVLHEVTGDAAILVDPESVDSISRGMLELANLEGAGKQQRLAQLKLHVAQFSRSFAAQKWRHVLLNLGS